MTYSCASACSRSSSTDVFMSATGANQTRRQRDPLRSWRGVFLLARASCIIIRTLRALQRACRRRAILSNLLTTLIRDPWRTSRTRRVGALLEEARGLLERGNDAHALALSEEA